MVVNVCEEEKILEVQQATLRESGIKTETLIYGSGYQRLAYTNDLMVRSKKEIEKTFRFIVKKNEDILKINLI